MNSAWRFFPWAVAAAIGLVVAVNAGMVVAALQSFPGKANDAGFALSNHYDAVLARAEREAALGWTIAAVADPAGRAVVTVRDRDGAALSGVVVVASAQRPLGAAERRSLDFHEAAAGRYVANAALGLPGQWDLTLLAATGGRTMAATRRIIVH